MPRLSRRDLINQASLGLAALATGSLVLPAGAQPTPASGDLGTYGKYLDEKSDKKEIKAPAKWAPTEDNILGPFYRKGAPFRAKVTPPLEAGTVLLISGRVWGHDTKKPLAGVILDIWQANAEGRYDNDDPAEPPAADVFKNRTRVFTDENGYYEYETIHPGAYKIGPKQWRPSHIHYYVRHPKYKKLVTQLYFKGDPHNKTDQFIKDSLIVELREQKIGTAKIEVGTFDIILAAEK